MCLKRELTSFANVSAYQLCDVTTEMSLSCAKKTTDFRTDVAVQTIDANNAAHRGL